MEEQWWSIEVLDGRFSAALWRDSHGSALIEAVVTNRGLDWNWRHRSWGVVFEVRFADEQAWETFRSLPAVRAALDSVPDPVNGLLVYRGRGGSAGAGQPRRPRPQAGAGAMPMPLEEVPEVVTGRAQASPAAPAFIPAA